MTTLNNNNDIIRLKNQDPLSGRDPRSCFLAADFIIHQQDVDASKESNQQLEGMTAAWRVVLIRMQLQVSDNCMRTCGHRPL
jgi:hypothetical protein